MKEELVNLLECLPVEVFILWMNKHYEDKENIENWNEDRIRQEVEFIKSLIK